MAARKHIFRVLFHNQGKVYELYARKVTQGALYAFVELEDIIFGERSAVLVDPSEEKLKSEFAGVKRTFVPLHALIRIDEVDREGPNKIHDAADTSKVMPFPLPYGPPGRPGDS